MGTNENEVGKGTEQSTLEKTASDSNSRILLAIGDLHGDYYRLMRHLRELELLLPGTMAWNPERNNVDLILIGDYTDWRGEPLETSTEETTEDGSLGGYRILDLMLHISDELQKLRRIVPNFDSHFYPLIGNHDDMMLNSADVFKFVSCQELAVLLSKARNFGTWKRVLSEAGLNPGQIDQMYSFLNWYVQGGEVTIQGFGGMEAWRDAMVGEIGDYLRYKLYLAVIVNHRLFSHSLPDQSCFWRPLEEIVKLPDNEFLQARESFTWGRKVWGYDYSSGTRTNMFSSDELDKMLHSIGSDSAVIGHTPMSHSTEHVIAYDGRVINIDVHGSPGGKAFIEEYQGSSKDNKAPLRSSLMGSRRVECLA
ncbi:MAG: metallophosphoesterase [bacterium]|nr:metallophosphoesterase [bacterium]